VIQSIGTYLPPWRATTSAAARVPGGDEDVVTMAVAAGIGALEHASPDAPVTSVILASRDFPLLEGGNGAALLAGLGLGSTTDVREQLGGAPAALEAITDAADGTLVIGADVTGGAGASAVLCATPGAEITILNRVNRSLPVTTRAPTGRATDYADPRLLRELGVMRSVAELGLDAPPTAVAVAGLSPRDAAALAHGDVPLLPTLGASAAGFALAALGGEGRVVAVEQATVVAAAVGAGSVVVTRDERDAQTSPVTIMTSEADITISLAAYARAFDAKLKLEAARCTTCGTLSYPHRFRCLACGSEAPTETVPLPRDAEIYTLATIHVPVPGIATPYTVVVAELGDSGVRLLARLTGAPPGSAAIGDRGRMVFRRVAERTGVPDYGYAFLPDTVVAPSEVAA
jgi:uncharacterized OB-fold protein